MADDTNPTAPTPSAPVKPGYKTTEFWLSLAAKLLGAAFASGLIGDGTLTARIAGLAAMVLASLGYTVSRTLVKTAATVLLLALMTSPMLACAGKHPGQLAEHAAVDCAKQDAPAILAAVVALAVAAIGPPKVNWDQEELVAEQHGLEVGGCALAQFVHGMWPSASSPGTAVAALSAPDPARQAAFAALERLRGKVGGARFATAAGDL